jgi:hypothetical protein
MSVRTQAIGLSHKMVESSQESIARIQGVMLVTSSKTRGELGTIALRA